MNCCRSTTIHSKPKLYKRETLLPKGPFSKQIKLLISGDSGVGKTCLVNQYVKGQFQSDHHATIGIDFLIQDYEMDGEVFKLQLWDTAGQERFRSLTNTFYRHCLGALIVFDVCDRKSFDHLVYWMEEVYRNTIGYTPVIIIGNKTDCIDERQVSIEEANRFAFLHHCSYFETSAKNNLGLNDAIKKMMEIILKKVQ
jgi:small GTP-binding protein